MRNNHYIGLVLGSAWLGNLILDFYFSWFSAPDLLLLSALTIFFSGQRPFWVYLLLFSVLADVASGINLLGFHALFYGLIFLLFNGLKIFWQNASSASRLLLLIVSATSIQLLRIFLLFLITGIKAPVGWFWAIPSQLIIWLLIHSLTKRFLGINYASQ